MPIEEFEQKGELKMAKFNCFAGLIGRKKTKENRKQPSRSGEYQTPQRILQIKLEEPVKPLENDELNVSSDKVVDSDSPVGKEATEKAYDGEDEHEESASMKREFSDFDLQACAESASVNSSGFCKKDVRAELAKGNHEDVDLMENGGHVSDPGVRRAESWVNSPKLKRSCSNLETREVLSKIANHFPLSNSRALDDLNKLPAGMREGCEAIPGSPASVMTHRSADKVMLKKYSSRQILPSRSRRLWWKLFLWSHRNLHKHWVSKSQPLHVPALNQQYGYSSDILEPNQATKSSKAASPGVFTDDSMNMDRENCTYKDKKKWAGFAGQASSLWPHNEWVAFSAESSSLKRVDEWVKDLDIQNPVPADVDDDNNAGGFYFPPSPEADRSPAGHATQSGQHPDGNISEAILHANSIIQSLNRSSSLAHISSIGLKAIPSISHFSSLKSVNLSSNFIVQITPGSLPKGLHALNLSKNKISIIEGLRELTRLRVLDLSYNRISRIGQGLSNCVLIKELYLAGNKISNVEGLHRLLKLTVLDLSFNKITTAKAIGQLVANYNSLLALNILGNPIQSNISEDQLRKTVCGLLPKLVYLNKQSIKPQLAREVLTDSVAKAALGSSNSLHSRRKAVRRGNSSGSASPSLHRGSVGTKQKGSSSGSKSRTRHQLKKTSSAHTPSH